MTKLRSKAKKTSISSIFQGSFGTRASDRGPPATIIESLVMIWVLGMLWSEIKQLWDEGFKRYIHQWWNWLDFIMICLYLTTISIRLSAFSIFKGLPNDRFVIRSRWAAYEPMLVAEALFAVGNVFSFARIIYLFQTNPYLGPLQVRKAKIPEFQARGPGFDSRFGPIHYAFFPFFFFRFHLVVCL